MANRYAIATGNWSNPAIWDGGTLPQAGDVVRPNGFTVTIDQDINVSELTNDASAPAVAGGSFTFGAGRIINANIYHRQNQGGTLVSCTYGSGASVVNGNVLILSSGNSCVGIQVNGSSGGVLTVNGDVYHTGNNTAENCTSILLNSNGNGFRLVLNGLVSGSQSSSNTLQQTPSGVRVSSSYIVDVNGIVAGMLSPSVTFFTGRSNGIDIIGINRIN
jgi:hypothetical protein